MTTQLTERYKHDLLGVLSCYDRIQLIAGFLAWSNCLKAFIVLNFRPVLPNRL
jgi:hypothetical protein